MTDFYRDTSLRYEQDPAFRAAVATLEQLAAEHGFTPGELKQIAFKAALNLELRSRPIMFITRDGPSSHFSTHGRRWPTCIVDPIPELPTELWPPPPPIQDGPSGKKAL